ncbi:MAG: outer membrane lipoprotein carrier protein LolA [Methylovirgula sp.]
MRLNFGRAGVSGLFLGAAMAVATFATTIFAEAATATATTPPISQNSAPPAATPPFKPMDPHVAIQKADDYFNSTRSMIGDFVQISGDRRSEGKVYIQKPGKMRLNMPSQQRLISSPTA